VQDGVAKKLQANRNNMRPLTNSRRTKMPSSSIEKREPSVLSKVRTICWMRDCCLIVFSLRLTSYFISSPHHLSVLFPIQDLSAFTKTFDTNGVLFYLGTEGGTRAYKNPQLTGVIAVQMSTIYTVFIAPMTIF
jgi:hypothetical protein